MIKDKLTKSIAEAAKAVMVETWPDSAMTSLYVDKPGKTPISDDETAASHTMTDEGHKEEFKVGDEIVYRGRPAVITDVSNGDIFADDEDGGSFEVNPNLIDWHKIGRAHV